MSELPVSVSIVQELRVAALLGALCLMSTAAGTWFVQDWSAARFLLQSALVWAFAWWQAWQRRALNMHQETGAPVLQLGWANRLTLLRGVLIAATGGCLLQPLAGALAWLPALLYGTAAGLDWLDGHVARRSGQTTRLGSELDTAFDALGLLVAPLVAVGGGKLHWSYLAVSIAYYLFVTGLHWRRTRNLPVLPLPPSRLRRVLAGAQMVFVALALWPTLPAALTSLAGLCFMLPLLVGFAADWLAVCGRLRAEHSPTADAFWRQGAIGARLLRPALLLLLWSLALLMAASVLQGLPRDEIAATAARLTWPELLCWAALNLAVILLGTWRWQILSRALGVDPGFGVLLRLRQAGQAVSFLTPGPQFGGEPLQIFWLQRIHGWPLHKTVLALGLDRFCELWVNFSVLLLGVLLLLVQGSGVAQWHQVAALLLLALLLLAGCGWLLLRRPQREGQGLWQARLQQFGAGLKSMLQTSQPVLSGAFGLSLLGWAALLAELALLSEFVGVDFTLHGFVLLVVALRLAMLLPLPGGIGTVEAAVLWSFQMLQLPVGAAVALLALLRLRDAVVLLAGLACLGSIRMLRGKRAPATEA